jgi:hypothetical protein
MPMAGKLKVGPTPSERRALGLRGPGYSPQCEGAVHMFGGGKSWWTHSRYLLSNLNVSPPTCTRYRPGRR